MQSTQRAAADPAEAGGEAAAWQAFAGAITRDQVAQGWLAALCGMFRETRAGLLLLGDAETGFAPLAVWPDQSDLQHLGGVAQEALMQRRGVVDRSTPDALRFAYPLMSGEDLFGAVVLDLRPLDGAALTRAMRMVHWGAGWLVDTRSRAQSEAVAARLERATFVFETAMAAMAEDNFGTASLTAVNRIAQRFDCHRVLLGVEDGRAIRIAAVSHSAWFDVRTNAMSLAAQAMNEAYDQRARISHPQADSGGGAISAALARYAADSGSGHLLAMPIEAGNDVAGVWLLERDNAFSPEQIEALEAVSMGLAGVLDLKQAADESLLAHARRSSKRIFMRLTDTSHPGAKLALGIGALVLLALALVPTDFRVPSRAIVEGAVQRVAVAPFQGYIREAPARAGDLVKSGQTLAVLDDRDLRLEKVRWESELEVALRKASEGMSKADRVSVRMSQAQADQARAQLDLVGEKLARVRVAAPFDGVVVRGDLTQELGSPVEQGKVLFEIAPLDTWRVILKVDERDIAYVKTGAPGNIVLTSLPGQTIALKVRQVTPVSTAEEGRNYFRVEATLPEGAAKLRPGMEGIAKIEAGEKSLLWIWTRRMIDWLRLAIWEYTP
jgi:multidrug resistance efflux pump